VGTEKTNMRLERGRYTRGINFWKGKTNFKYVNEEKYLPRGMQKWSHVRKKSATATKRVGKEVNQSKKCREDKE